jgi:DHA1 family tetracycline resistance protein-like MFS transporter
MRSVAKYLALEGNIRVMAVQALVSSLGFGMFFVVWQPYILSTGVSVVDLGVVQSVINLSTAAGLIAWGVLSDRFGRKPVILVSQACRLLSMVALIVSGEFAFLILFAFLMGFSAMFMIGNPARSALITESVDSQSRATAFSTLMSISQITNTVMASAGGYIAMTSGYTPILYACVAVDLLGLLLLAAFLRETREKPVEARPAGGLVAVLRDLFMPEPGIGRLYLMLIVAGFGYGTGYSLLYGILVDSYGLTELQLGLLSTAFNLTWGLSSIPVGKISDRFSRKTMLMASWAAGMITVTGFLLFRSFEAFLLLQVVSALDPVLWIPAWMALLSEKIPSERLSTVMGKIDAYSKLAGIPTPWLGGLLYSAYGFTAPLTVHLGCMAIFGFLIYTLKEK